jgi:hypothetical protein
MSEAQKPALVDTLDTQTELQIRSVIDTLERALAEAKEPAPCRCSLAWTRSAAAIASPSS